MTTGKLSNVAVMLPLSIVRYLGKSSKTTKKLYILCCNLFTFVNSIDIEKNYGILRVVKKNYCRCGGSLLARQTSAAEVPGSNPASTAMILMHCGIIVLYCKIPG